MLKFKKGDWVKEVNSPHCVGVVAKVDPEHGFYPYVVKQESGRSFWMQEEMISACDAPASVSAEDPLL
jgi:hypothetical protein